MLENQFFSKPDILVVKIFVQIEKKSSGESQVPMVYTIGILWQ